VIHLQKKKVEVMFTALYIIAKHITLKIKPLVFNGFPKEKESNVAWTNKNVVKEYNDRRRAWAINLRMDKKTF